MAPPPDTQWSAPPGGPPWGPRQNAWQVPWPPPISSRAVYTAGAVWLLPLAAIASTAGIAAAVHRSGDDTVDGIIYLLAILYAVVSLGVIAVLGIDAVQRYGGAEATGWVIGFFVGQIIVLPAYLLYRRRHGPDAVRAASPTAWADASAMAGKPPRTPPPRRWHRIVTIGVPLASLALVFVLITLFERSGTVSDGAPGGGRSGDGCAPVPCAVAHERELDVLTVDREFVASDGRTYVALQLRFHNNVQGEDLVIVSAGDLQLRDSTRRVGVARGAPDCQWTEDVEVWRQSDYIDAPLVCFDFGGQVHGPLILTWAAFHNPIPLWSTVLDIPLQ